MEKIQHYLHTHPKTAGVSVNKAIYGKTLGHYYKLKKKKDLFLLHSNIHLNLQ